MSDLATADVSPYRTVTPDVIAHSHMTVQPPDDRIPLLT
jgi:hypothetical protein